MTQRRPIARAVLLTADAALHIAVLAWFVMGSRPEEQQARVLTPSLTAFDLSQDHIPAALAPPAPQPKPSAAEAAIPAAIAPSITPPPISIELQVATIIGDRAIAALTPPAGAVPVSTRSSMGQCDLTVPVQTALRADAAASASRLPRSSLSIARAYVLWNAGWIAPRQPSTAALDAIRGVIEAQVARASAACRDQVQLGPRFVLIGPQSAPLTLVIGSGSWRWGDLLIAPENALPENRKNTSLTAI